MKAAMRGAIAPFMAMEAFREAALVAQSGATIAHLSIGQPAARPPLPVMEKVAQAALTQGLGYTDAPGLPQLRAKIAAHYLVQYGVEVDPQQIFVTVGSSAAYMTALLSAFDAGDRVALVSPHYPASPNMMRALGIEPVIIASTLETHFQPTVAMLEKLPQKPQGLVIASPSNPAGTIIERDVLRELSAYCEAENIRIISDEIYHGITYDGVAASTVLEHSSRMIVTNSFSKYYLLPGWRLGWCVLPPELLRNAESLLQNFYISPPTISQHAAMAIMDCRDELDAVVASYQANRDWLLAELPKAGFTRIGPSDGAFYLYADVSELTNDSSDFCHRMLHEAHVCAVPGIDFDAEQGHRYVRFSFCGSLQTMQTATQRLIDWMAHTS